MKPQVEGSELIHQIPDFDHLLIDLPSTISILGVPKGDSGRSKVKVTFCVSKITLFLSARQVTFVIQRKPKTLQSSVNISQKTFWTQNLWILMIIGSKRKSCGVPFLEKLTTPKTADLGYFWVYWKTTWAILGGSTKSQRWSKLFFHKLKNNRDLLLFVRCNISEKDLNFQCPSRGGSDSDPSTWGFIFGCF